jgi:hypothetical protein
VSLIAQLGRMERRKIKRRVVQDLATRVLS